MEEEEYEELASKLLESISAQIEEMDINNHEVDVDYDGEILTLGLEKGKYIINKHNSAKQIWMVSPITGPHHFHFFDDQWINDQDENILQLISDELRAMKINIQLKDYIYK
jgi:iron donor protein CyaY